MKRLTIFLIIAALLTGSIYAQPMTEQRALEQHPMEQLAQEQRTLEQRTLEQRTQTRESRETRQRENNSVTVQGILKLERGIAVVESSDAVYYVPVLTRFMGFISELTEGAVVSVDGYGFRNFIHPTKFTVDGKTYDFTAMNVPAFGQNNPRNLPQARETPRPQKREDLRQNPPEMGKTPRFNQPNRNVPAPRNAPGRNNTCNCNCRSGSPQRRS